MMKAKTRVILEEALEEGIRIGYRRAFKHSDTPEEHWILENIQNEIMNCIDLRFDFVEENYQ